MAIEIREFERKVREAVDDFFEDYKTAALLNKDDYPLTQGMLDWTDKFCDGIVERLRVEHGPVLIHQPPDFVACGPNNKAIIDSFRSDPQQKIK